MPVIHDDVERKIISLLQRYYHSGKVELNHFLHKDLRIDGWDGIDVTEDIEEMFEVDLRPLVASVTTYLPPNWWDRLLGRDHGPAIADISVGKLVDYVVAHAGETAAPARPDPSPD